MDINDRTESVAKTNGNGKDGQEKQGLKGREERRKKEESIGQWASILVVPPLLILQPKEQGKASGCDSIPQTTPLQSNQH